MRVEHVRLRRGSCAWRPLTPLTHVHVQANERLRKLMDDFPFFSSTEFRFSNAGSLRLMNSMTPSDRKVGLRMRFRRVLVRLLSLACNLDDWRVRRARGRGFVCSLSSARSLAHQAFNFDTYTIDRHRFLYNFNAGLQR